MLGTTLDVAIGLIFIFMLFSLFLSTVLEAVAAAFKLRARALEITIAQLIEYPASIRVGANLPAKGLFGLSGWISRKTGWGQPGAAINEEGELIADEVAAEDAESHEGPTEGAEDIVPTVPLSFKAVYEHPLVGAIPGRRPGYVPAKNFTSAVLYAVGGGQGSLQSDLEQGIAALPPGTLRTALTTALIEAEGDMEKMRTGIERWYDNAMERLSGQYKRFSQAATFLLALILALAFHLDAVEIGQRLYVDAALRGAFVDLADSYVEKHPDGPGTVQPVPVPAVPVPAAPPAGNGAGAPAPTPAPSPAPATPEQQLADFKKRAAEAGEARQALVETMSLFGRFNKEAERKAEEARRAKRSTIGNVWHDIVLFLLGTIGILVTALAGMLGGPFWFDVLQRMVNLRASGAKPAPAGKDKA